MPEPLHIVADPAMDAVGAGVTVIVTVCPVIVAIQPDADVALVNEYVVVDAGVTVTVPVVPVRVVLTVELPFQ